MNRKASRRKLLKFAAAAGVTSALGETLFTSAPWLDYDSQAKRTWDTPFRMEATGMVLMRELIRYATLAPSGHNAQPWKFAVVGSAIRIYPDYSRRLNVVDPQDRELWISLGCALENLVIAAQHAGYEVEVSYPASDAEFITLHLRPSSLHNPTPLYEAIVYRQNTRSLYDGRQVPSSNMKHLETVTTGNGISVGVLTATGQKETILEYIKAANQRQYNDQTFINELVSWLRFNKPEAIHSLDGLYSGCTGNPNLPRWLGSRFVTAARAGRQSLTDEKAVRSSSGLVVIASTQDDKLHWIETGRTYERLALTLTALGIKTAFLNQPVEVAGLRSQLQSYLDLGATRPQLILRFGYAPTMLRSLRRPVEQVLA